MHILCRTIYVITTSCVVAVLTATGPLRILLLSADFLYVDLTDGQRGRATQYLARISKSNTRTILNVVANVNETKNIFFNGNAKSLIDQHLLAT